MPRRLARRCPGADPGVTLARAMEKFLIDGGRPLERGDRRGRQQERRAADSLAACLLTEEEVVLSNVPAHPRHRGPGRACSRALGREGRAGAGRTRSACRPTTVSGDDGREGSPAGSAPPSWLAGPLLARFGEATMPPPGGDTIGRRRLDPHLDAFRDLGAKVSGDRHDRAERAARRAQALPDLHGRALGDGNRERADGRRADAGPDDDRQRRLRAARPGPRPPAGRDGRADRRDRLQRDDRPRPRQARRRRAPDHPRPHRGRQLHGARRGDRRRAAHPRRPSPRT